MESQKSASPALNPGKESEEHAGRTESSAQNDGFEDLLTVEEAAHALRIDEDTVRNWLRTGQISGYKLGRSWRISRSDLKAFLVASKRNALEPALH